MEWQMTTFGELKAGDWYSINEPTPYMVELHCRATDPANDDTSETVYRLVSPEREALEKIVAMVCDCDNDDEMDMADKWIKAFAIAKEALEVKS